MKLVKLGNKITFSPEYDGKVIEALTSGIYEYWMSPDAVGLELTADKFPKREIVGTQHDHIARLIGNDILDGTATGALFTGLKGTGKTMTMEHVANKAIEVSGYAVLRVTSYLPETLLRKFIEITKGKCVIFIDEYANKYSEDNGGEDRDESVKATSLLELLSDVTVGPVIWLLSANELKNISDYVLNRPQRLAFHLRYVAVTDEVRDILMEDIEDPDMVNYLLAYHREIGQEVSFDVFSKLCNLAKEASSYQEFLKDITYYNVPQFEIRYPTVSYAVENEDDEVKLDTHTLEYDSEKNEVKVTELDKGNVHIVKQSTGGSRIGNILIHWSDIPKPLGGELVPRKVVINSHSMSISALNSRR